MNPAELTNQMILGGGDQASDMLAEIYALRSTTAIKGAYQIEEMIKLGWIENPSDVVLLRDLLKHHKAFSMVKLDPETMAPEEGVRLLDIGEKLNVLIGTIVMPWIAKHKDEEMPKVPDEVGGMSEAEFNRRFHSLFLTALRYAQK